MPSGVKPGKAAGATGVKLNPPDSAGGLAGVEVGLGANGLGVPGGGANTGNDAAGVGVVGGTGVAGTTGLAGITRASALGFSSIRAPTAVVLSGVSVRACKSAFLSRRDERSMLSAAAEASLIFSFLVGGNASGAKVVDTFRRGALSFIRTTRAVK